MYAVEHSASRASASCDSPRLSLRVRRSAVSSLAIMGTASGIGEPLGADSAGVPTDPLHERIASYELHGYPERSRYLERAHHGPELLEQVKLGAPGATRGLLDWWTGDPDTTTDLERAFAALTAADACLANVGAACPASTLKRLQDNVDKAREVLPLALDAVIVAGLRARVDCWIDLHSIATDVKPSCGEAAPSPSPC